MITFECVGVRVDAEGVLDCRRCLWESLRKRRHDEEDEKNGKNES